MIHYYSKEGMRVGDIVEVNYYDTIYKAKVIETGYYDFEYGTQGWAAGDKYFQVWVEFKLENGITMRAPFLNNIHKDNRV